MNSFKELRMCKLFNTLSDLEFEELLNTANFSYKSFHKNAILFSPFDLTQHIAIIIKGTVEVHQLQLSGTDIILDTKGPTDLIAGPSVYSSQPRYANTIVASKACDVILFDKKEWRRLIHLQPKLLDTFLQFLSDQVLFMSIRLSLLSQPTLKKKLVSYLMQLYCSKNTLTLTLPFSKKKLSDYLNAQAQSLSRTFKELVDDGYIIMEKDTIQILNVTRLAALLN